MPTTASNRTPILAFRNLQQPQHWPNTPPPFAQGRARPRVVSHLANSPKRLKQTDPAQFAIVDTEVEAATHRKPANLRPIKPASHCPYQQAATERLVALSRPCLPGTAAAPLAWGCHRNPAGCPRARLS